MSAFQVYEYIFMTELLVAGGLFSRRVTRRRYFPLRAAGGIAACYLSVFLLTLTGAAGAGWEASLIFLAMFAVLCCAILIMFDISVKGMLFCAIAAYTAQHLAYEAFKLIFAQFDIFVARDMYGSDPFDFSNLGATFAVVALVYVNIYLAVYASVWFAIGRKIGDGKDLGMKGAGMFVLSGMILLIDILLNAVVVYIVEEYSKLYDTVAGIYNVLCCVLVFYVQRNILYEKHVVGELEVVTELLAQANRQYALKKEEIDLINMKCHDMKHFIGAHMGAGGVDDGTLAEMSEMVSLYDASVKTGNDVIDLILTDKSLICRSRNIRITCMADCRAMGFVGSGDLYALFGNIMDNAIEAAGEVEDESKRCIAVNIREAAGWISVTVENYFTGELSFSEDGLPLTRKAKKSEHGFGLKSVRHVAEKYGGNMVLEARGDVFRTSVLLRVPGGAESAENTDENAA